jgi:hypothetical protein
MKAKIQKKCLHRFRKPLLYPFELRERANRENTPAALNGKRNTSANEPCIRVRNHALGSRKCSSGAAISLFRRRRFA